MSSARSSSRVHAQEAIRVEKNKEEQEKAEKVRIEKEAAAAERKEAAAAKKLEKDAEEEKRRAEKPVIKLKLKASKPPTASASAKVDQAMEAYQKALAESLPSSATVNSALSSLEIQEESPKPAVTGPSKPLEKKPVMSSLMAAAMGETYIPGPEDLPKAPKQQRKKFSATLKDDSDEEKDDVEMDDKKKGSGKRRARTTIIDDTDDDDDEEEEDEKPMKKAKKIAVVKAEPESRKETPRPAAVKAPKKPEGGPMQKYVQGGKKESKPKESRPLPSVPLPLPALPIRPHRAPTPEDVLAAQGLANELHQATEAKNWSNVMSLLSPSGAIAQLPKTIELSSSSSIAMRLRGAQSAAALASNETSGEGISDSGSNLASEALQLCNNMLSMFKEECKAIVEWDKAYKIALEELQIVEKKNAEIEARAAAAAAKAAAKEAERAAAKQAETDLRESRLANLKSSASDVPPSSDANMEDSALFSSEGKVDSSPKVFAALTAKNDKPQEKPQEKPQSSSKIEGVSSKPLATVSLPIHQKAVASTASLLKGMQQSSSKPTSATSAPSAKVPSSAAGSLQSSALAKELALLWPTSSETIEVGNVQVPHSTRSTAAMLLHALFQESALWPASVAAPTPSEHVQRWVSRITERLAISAENKLFEATQLNASKSAPSDGSAEPLLLKLQRALDTLLVSAREEKNRPAYETSDISTPRAAAARQLFMALQETAVKARTSVLSSTSSASSDTIKEDDKQRDAISNLLPLVFSLCAQVV